MLMDGGDAEFQVRPDLDGGNARSGLNESGLRDDGNVK